MSTFAWNDLFAALLRETCGHTRFFYNGEAVPLSDISAPDGLLPVFMAQALTTAGVMGGIPGITMETTPDAATGQKAVFDGAPPCLTLPFFLDSALLARELSWANHAESVGIQVESIMPPVQPTMEIERLLKQTVTPEGQSQKIVP